MTVRDDLDAAEYHYRRAVEVEPTSARFYDNLGLLLQNGRRDYEAAEAMFLKASAIDPKFEQARARAGLSVHGAPRRRRGRDADIPRRRVAATPRPRRG